MSLAPIALLDCNNFYATAETVFRPSLRGIPLVILGSNDGCVVARSQEAKALGVKMGQPYFEIRHLEEAHGLLALSANFELYGDLSERVMSLAAELGPHQEIYSIDEAFHSLAGVRGDLRQRCKVVRDKILAWTGVACCVGVGPNKTLAKLANHVAKQAERKPGSYDPRWAQICDLGGLERKELAAILRQTPVGDVWGVGRRLDKQLQEHGVHNALDLARLEPALVRSRWSVVLERTVRELRGQACFGLEESPAPRQQIAVTRSLGTAVSSLPELERAIGEFCSTAAMKLRRQQHVCASVWVFARTSPFRPGPAYSGSIRVPLLRPTDDSMTLATAAVAGLRTIFKPGVPVAKLGVMLLELTAGHQHQGELDFGPSEDPFDPAAKAARESPGLMKAVDSINERWGRGTLRIAGSRQAGPAEAWTSKQQRRTPAYTTRWEDMPTVRA